MIENILYLLVVVVGCVISYEDFRTGKVRNTLILLLILLTTGVFVYRKFSINNPISIVLSSMYTFFVSFFLWAMGFWPAGDAKLFIIYSIFLSMIVPDAFTKLLVNTFVPFFLFYSFLLPAIINKKKVKSVFKQSFSTYNLFLVSVVFFGFVWFIGKGLSLIHIPSDFLINFLILFTIMEIVNRIFPFNLEFFYVICAIIRMVIDYQTVYSINFWIELFKIVIIYQFFVSFMLKLSLGSNIKKVRIDDLKPGMVLKEGIIKSSKRKKQVYEKKNLDPLPLRIFKQRPEFIHNITDDGLTLEDVKRIKQLKKKNKINFDEITIYKPIPFAAFITLGLILTLILKQDINNFIRYSIYHK